jgi:predicted nucleic acid-binding Zn ribbon protein
MTLLLDLEIEVMPEAGRSCAVCGSRMRHGGRGRPPATCSDACREKRKKEQQRYIPSGISRCDAVRAWHASRGTARVPKQCVVCAKDYVEKRPGTTCCSRECGFEYQKKNHLLWMHYKCDHPPAPTDCAQCGAMHIMGGQWCGDECRAIDAVETEAERNELRTLHAECTECGIQFSFCALQAGGTPAQCSSSCSASAIKEQRRMARYVRRMRMDSREREDFHSREIYERDMWFCMLCGGKTDPTKIVPHPLAPTLDHAIPIAKGGCHTRRNVQTAHFLCNSLKSDKL